jgi:FkbM family methyltransferase
MGPHPPLSIGTRLWLAAIVFSRGKDCMSRLKTLWRNRTKVITLLRASRPIFSQFGEDLAIATLLRPQSKGTYVDVGANHPFNGSNTAYLYMLGWSGLAIEPNPAFSREYKKARPRDKFLTAGVAESNSELTYYEFQYDKLNTFSSARAEQLSNEGNPPVRERKIPCSPLSTLIAEHMPERHVDLLSVDCEGLDLQVLKSARLDQLRPSALLVEDFMQYVAYRDGIAAGEFDEYLRSMEYSPIFQCAWSSIYVSNNWRELQGSGAFSPPESLSDYMPKPRRPGVRASQLPTFKTGLRLSETL